MDLPWTNAFLSALASGCTVSEAASAAGIASATAYGRKQRDADFAEAWRLALEDSVDLLEREARRRAVDGVEEPVVYQGHLTPVLEYDSAGQPVLDENGKPIQARHPDGSPKWLTIRKPSDTLLALLLKGRRKDVFSDRTELTGANGGPVATTTTIITGVPAAGEIDISDLV